MIELTKWSGGGKFILNAWHIEQIEETPDTIVLLSNGKRYIVKESAQEVAYRAKQFFTDTSPKNSISYQKGAEEHE